MKKLDINKGHTFRIVLGLFLLFSVFSISFAAAETISNNNSCVDCHKVLSPFTDEQARFNAIRQNHINRSISCSLECHEDIIRKTANDNFQQWSDSVHSEYYVTCDNCHGGNPSARTKVEAHAGMKNMTNYNSTIYFKNIPETCGKCHTEELNSFKNTMHFQRLKAESLAPSCITCHKPHTFKVLKASELTPLCSVCHNSTGKIAPANVPKDAENALNMADDFKNEVLKAKNAIAEAKGKGQDISSAQADLDRATVIEADIPSLWHGFNLDKFDQQMQSGIYYAKNAESKISGTESDVKTTPGFEAIAGFGVLVIIFSIMKRVR